MKRVEWNLRQDLERSSTGTACIRQAMPTVMKDRGLRHIRVGYLRRVIRRFLPSFRGQFVHDVKELALGIE